MQTKLPLIVRVSIQQARFDPDAVDAEVYCVNKTAQVFTVTAQSESFTTIDEEEGVTTEHGSPPGKHRLLPGESVLLAAVRGWEWDGHVGIRLTFQVMGTKSIVIKSYNLKESKTDFTISSLGKKGRVISPIQ